MRVAAGLGGLLLVASPLSAEDLASQDSEEVDTVAGPTEPAAAVDSEVVPKKPEIEFVWTQFLATSVRENIDDEWQYGGRFDIYAKVPGSTIGLDDSLAINIHPEFRYGNSVNGDIGLLPPQTGLFYPSDDGEEVDLSLSVTKTWKSGTSLQVGKVNVLDIAKDLPIIGGGGIEGFSNLALALPPSTIVPQELVGALLTVPTKKVLYRFWVYDPKLRTQDTGLEDPFATGVGVFATATVPVKLGGKPGYYAIKFAGTTRTGPPTEVLPAALVIPPGARYGRKKGTAAIILAGYQVLDLYKDAPGKGWGIFGQVFVSDGDPTPIDISGFAGISGNVPGRPQDHFGLAWFRYSLSDQLIDDLAPFVAFEDEEGVEAFYTFEVAKPLRVTANVQYIDGAVTARKAGWAVGLRAVTRF